MERANTMMTRIGLWKKYDQLLKFNWCLKEEEIPRAVHVRWPGGGMCGTWRDFGYVSFCLSSAKVPQSVSDKRILTKRL